MVIKCHIDSAKLQTEKEWVGVGKRHVKYLSISKYHVKTPCTPSYVHNYRYVTKKPFINCIHHKLHHNCVNPTHLVTEAAFEYLDLGMFNDAVFLQIGQVRARVVTAQTHTSHYLLLLPVLVRVLHQAVDIYIWETCSCIRWHDACDIIKKIHVH